MIVLAQISIGVKLKPRTDHVAVGTYIPAETICVVQKTNFVRDWYCVLAWRWGKRRIETLVREPDLENFDVIPGKHRNLAQLPLPFSQ